MPCRTFRIETSAGIVTGTMCGPKARKQRCKFCGADAKHLCDWPVKKLIPFAPKPGSKLNKVTELLQLRRFDSGKDPYRFKIKDTVWAGSFLTIWAIAENGAETRATLRVDQFKLSDGKPLFWIEGRGTCDKPCCFRHRRHIGPDRDYCMDHWELKEGDFR